MAVEELGLLVLAELDVKHWVEVVVLEVGHLLSAGAEGEQHGLLAAEHRGQVEVQAQVLDSEGEEEERRANGFQ